MTEEWQKKGILTRDIVDWVLAHYTLLSEGIWPDRDAGDIAIKVKIMSHHAPFEAACLIAGEVAARVKMCGDDGYLVEEHYGMKTGIQKELIKIANERHMFFDNLERRIKKVKGYVSDDEDNTGRRKESYANWFRSVRNRREYR